MMDSASYACTVAVSVAVRLPEAANDQNVVLLECSTLTPPLSSLIPCFSRPGELDTSKSLFLILQPFML